MATLLLLIAVVAVVMLPISQRVRELMQGPAELALAEFLASSDRQSRDAAADRLVKYGYEAPALLAARIENDPSHRRKCFDLLRERFPTHPATVDAAVALLRSEQCAHASAYHVGQFRIAAARDALRRSMEDDPEFQFIRAWALAQLNESDGIGTLCLGLCSDDGYTRYLSSQGLAALTGKDCSDLGYDYLENGGFMGVWVEVLVTPEKQSELRASRLKAVGALLRWLQQERPDLYQQIDNMDALSKVLERSHERNGGLSTSRL